MPKSTSKTKTTVAVSPHVAEATPDLSAKTNKTRSKKTPAIGGNEKDAKPKNKRPADNNSDEESSAPAPLKKKKVTAVDTQHAISARKDEPISKTLSKPKETTVNSDDGDELDTHLRGFSSDSDSSDEDEDDGVDDAHIDVGKLPTIAKDDATVKRKLDKAKKQPTADRGVLYLGRIPHGFYEEEMRAYFTQFGEVTRLRLSRNKKTGRSKHYAFLEFSSSSVAQIVSETMDNYLLLGHILICKVIPKDEVNPELWIGSNRKWRKVPTDRVARVVHNRDRGEEEQKRSEAKLLKRQRQKQRKLAEAGIHYDLSAVGYTQKPLTT